MGDGFLVSFASPTDAVHCAVDIQRRHRDYNAATVGERKLVVPIGYHRLKTSATRWNCASDLRVGTRLSGSVRRSDEAVRIAVQLIDGATEEQVRANRYSFDTQDIFTVQTEIAERVAGEPEVVLSKEEITGACCAFSR